jgi:hypothetical protein
LHHGFFADAKAGTLPDFSYIEPKWGYEAVSKVVGNDYHPPIFVGCGEHFLYQVYTHLQQSPQWKDTLLIVTFDEHGGTYDHVPPPGTAINPDGINGIENGFKFDQFGARVPTLLISPYIPKGTVFRSGKGDEHPYDHTSFIKTVLMWAGMTRDEIHFGNRAQDAPTFEGVLSDQRVNLSPSVSPPADGVTCNATDARLMAGTDQLINVPFGVAKYILRTSKTKEEVAAAVALYRQDPKKFEAENLAPRRSNPADGAKNDGLHRAILPSHRISSLPESENSMLDRTKTPESVAKELIANPLLAQKVARPEVSYTVTLTNSGGYYLMSWQEDVAGSYDWVGLYANSSVPDSDYLRNCNYNWQWAVNGNSYRCCTPVSAGHQARYLVWDANQKKYVAVAWSNLL